jgi:hypothetical protein
LKREWAERYAAMLEAADRTAVSLLDWTTRVHDGPNTITSATGYAVAYDLGKPWEGRGLTIRRDDIVKAITPYYVAGWQASGGELFLHPLRSLDPLTPRRAYHLRVFDLAAAAVAASTCRYCGHTIRPPDNERPGVWVDVATGAGGCGEAPASVYYHQPAAEVAS